MSDWIPLQSSVCIVDIVSAQLSLNHLIIFSDNLSADTILSIDVFRKGSMFASCAKVILSRFHEKLHQWPSMPFKALDSECTASPTFGKMMFM